MSARHWLWTGAVAAVVGGTAPAVASAGAPTLADGPPVAHPFLAVGRLQVAAERAPATSRPAPARVTTTRLSDERSRSRWAFVLARAYARRRPDRHAHVVHAFRRCDRSGCYTSDDTPELVLALAERRSPDGGDWVLVRLPMRPNNRVGWVRRSRLGRLHTVTTHLVIDRRRLRATLYDHGRRVWRAPVGIGKPSTPTPRGHYYLREGLRTGRTDGLYGAYAFGTSAYSAKLTDWPGGGVIGIHGTNQPQLIPGRPSHGCVRLRNAGILRLKRHLRYDRSADEVGLGVPLTIVH